VGRAVRLCAWKVGGNATGRACAAGSRPAAAWEALCALAGYTYERPDDPFPEIADDGPLFEADGLAHPLLSAASAIRNDVRLGGEHGPRLLLVSGSNMSGKSTLLRAIGVNVVLALAGAPVRAIRLRLSPLCIGASLRTQDSLQEGVSRFYAEILRLKQIVDIAERGPCPLLFLLDEILAGTNSADRRAGADALVHVLVEKGAIGLVTTHDLALTRLVESLGDGRSANVHFEDHLDENGRINFDYRLRPGVVEKSNALALMRAVGLDV
jgi:DNA mismatch repair ATPase MutS